jgi:hypothetical protein
MEWAPRAGQVESWEFTGVPGFRKKTHGKAASIPQRRVQASGRRGVSRWRDPVWSGEAARPLPQSDPGLGREIEAGAFDDDTFAADLIQAYEARIAALERLVGKQALELEFLRGASASAARARNAPTSVITGSAVSPSPKDAG